ncbi:MAG: DUF6364 family protein [Bacteroidia bacterium]
MNAKLTLTINPTIISSAKKYAKIKGKSLSDIIENYLKTLTVNDNKNFEVNEKILKLKGVINLPENFDYKKTLTKSLDKKYKK